MLLLHSVVAAGVCCCCCKQLQAVVADNTSSYMWVYGKLLLLHAAVAACRYWCRGLLLHIAASCCGWRLCELLLLQITVDASPQCYKLLWLQLLHFATSHCCCCNCRKALQCAAVAACCCSHQLLLLHKVLQKVNAACCFPSGCSCKQSLLHVALVNKSMLLLLPCSLGISSCLPGFVLSSLPKVACRTKL